MRNIIILLVVSFKIMSAQPGTGLKQYQLRGASGKLIIEGYYYESNSLPGEQIRVGEWKEYNDSSGYLLRTWKYKNGKYHGNSFWYYPDGKIKISGKYNYKHSQKSRIDENGNEIFYTVPFGTWKYYCPNGKLQKRTYYDKEGQIKKEVSKCDSC